MARVSDVPKVIKSLGLVPFAKKVWSEVTQDDVFTWGSALAYAWIFAIFPFLVFMLTLAPYLPWGVKDRVMTEVSNVTYSSMDAKAADSVYMSVYEVVNNQKGGLLSIGLFLALWGASGGMTMTMTALDKAYYVHCSRGFLKQRAIAMGLTVASAVLILVVVLLLPVGTSIVEYLAKHGHLDFVGKVLVNLVRYVIALGMMFLIVSMIYFFGPCIKAKWQTITPGAVFTVLAWVVGGIGFAIYVKNFGNFNATYGALGGAIILLLFFYISAVVLLIGAEINSVIDFEVLNVKPGATDLTQARAKEKYEDRPDEAERTPAGLAAAAAAPPAQVRHLPIITTTPRRGAMRKVAIYGTSLLALRWAWRKGWAMRAKKKQREAQERARRPWWLRWAM
jgi:membrane protein